MRRPWEMKQSKETGAKNNYLCTPNPGEIIIWK